MDPFTVPKVERTVDERVARGERARELRSNELLQEAHAAAQSRLLQAWRHSKSVEERERAWAAISGLDLVQKELDIIVQDGEHARVRQSRES